MPKDDLISLVCENIRRREQEELNANAGEREALETKYGKVWNPAELSRDFEVQGFAAPYVVVRRKADGKLGSLQFQHSPRYYFNWEEDKS